MRAPPRPLLRRTLGTPVAQYFHAEEIGARPRLAAFAAEQADAVIAVSAYTAELVAARVAAPVEITVIPNGVDLVPDAPAELCERPTFLTVARVQERYKGHDVLVRALALVRAKVPQVQWVVIGEGSLRAGVEQLADSYGVADAARFLGAVSDEERDSWLARSQLLAMPSRLPAGAFAGEGFGIAFLEAAAHGAPGRRRQRRRRDRRGHRRRDGPAGRSVRPARRRRGDHAAAARPQAWPSGSGARDASARRRSPGR